MTNEMCCMEFSMYDTTGAIWDHDHKTNGDPLQNYSEQLATGEKQATAAVTNAFVTGTPLAHSEPVATGDLT